MPLTANATLTFTAYQIAESGVVMDFVCSDPGPGMATDWSITLTDTDLSVVTTGAQFRTLVQTRLSRLIRGTGLASKLDSLIGQSVTV